MCLMCPTLVVMQRLDAEEMGHLVMVQGVDVLVDRVPRQLHLGIT